MFLWTVSDFPEARYGSAWWVQVLRAAHEWFTPCNGPNPLVIYRGTNPEYARRMAWTTDPSVAYGFAWRQMNQFYPRAGATKPSVAYLYRTTVNIDAVLLDVRANGNLSGRLYEKEVLVDPAGLENEIVCVLPVHTGDDMTYRP
jgi:hypothetical protein